MAHRVPHRPQNTLTARPEPAVGRARLPDMPVPSPRIAERLTADFAGAAPRMLSTLERLAVTAQVDPERVHAAILIAARGNQSMFQDAVEHAQSDWRDLLDRTGLADDDWRRVIDAEFGEDLPA